VAFVLGIVGSLIGFGLWALALVAVTVGGLWTRLDGFDVWWVSGQFLLALMLLFLGARGAVIAHKAPMRAATYLVIACVAGWVTLSRFWLLFGPFYLGGALFAWLGRPKTGD
jgi:hypothetical protein